jgi:hypothetical protein
VGAKTVSPKPGDIPKASKKAENPVSSGFFLTKPLTFSPFTDDDDAKTAARNRPILRIDMIEIE